MKAEIVSIGTELLLGTITDTNASYLAQRLAALGIDCFYVSQVGDNLPRLTATLRRAWERSDLVVATGGLGPTLDDLTREAIAGMLGEAAYVSPELEAGLRRFFASRSLKMPERNIKQATLIPSAEALRNPVGTAPGWWVSKRNGDEERILVTMPGVPYEMKRMWQNEVEPRLQSMTSTIILSHTLKVLGLGESAVEERVEDLMAGANPTLAPYAKQDGIHLRITAKASNPSQAEEMIAGLEAQLRQRLGDAIYATDEESPQSAVADLLQSQGLSCALLEVGSAIGSLTPLASNTHSAPLLSVAALPQLTLIVSSTTGVPCCDTLRSAVEAWHQATHADVVVAASATTIPHEEASGSLRVQAEILVATRLAGGSTHFAEAQQSWRTTPSEVSRLVGLAAINLLRTNLLQRVAI